MEVALGIPVKVTSNHKGHCIGLLVQALPAIISRTGPVQQVDEYGLVSMDRSDWRECDYLSGRLFPTNLV